MYRTSSLVAALLLAVGVAHAEPVKYNLDPNHTQVEFSWNHFGFSHITGRFAKVEGNFLFDPADPTKSSIDVSIPISSIDTGVAALDEHLQSPDFFDVTQFPVATFKSSKVERIGEHDLQVSGELTIHGVSKPAVLDVTINKIGEHPMAGRAAAGFDAKATIKRSDFGIAKYVPNVSDEIAIAITTEAMVPKPETAGAAAAK
ncbi:MAG TPA: YceI family protein [Luteimonas sp.]|nr:YceI family protein [Luteimonas sp.]